MQRVHKHCLMWLAAQAEAVAQPDMPRKGLARRFVLCKGKRI
jgi:hypothetical protein